MDVVALQELRWPYNGIVNSGNYAIYYSGRDDGIHQAGVGFAIRKNLLNTLVKFEALNERLSFIRLRGRFMNVTLINLYAPTEDKCDEEKDEFYGHLEDLLSKTPSYDVKIVLGDANAKIGKEDIWEGYAGKHSLHDVSNDNGTRLLSLACALNYIVASTLFPHRNIHKVTWVSPDGRTRNQIDHILIDKRHKNCIMDIKSLRGAECGTDHYLVLAKVRQRLCKAKREIDKVGLRWDTNKLKNQVAADEFYLKIKNRFEPLVQLGNSFNNVEDYWREIKSNITGILEEDLNPPRRKKKPWFNESCENLVKQRKEEKNKLLINNSVENKARFKEINKKVVKKLRTEKRKYIANQLQRVEEDNNKNHARDFYRTVRFFKQGFKPRTWGIKNSRGVTICEKKEVLKIWKDYFENLLNVPGQGQYEQAELMYQNVQPQVNEPTFEEVITVLRELKSHKAPGIDGIPMEVFKLREYSLLQCLYTLFLRVWHEECMPEDWNEAIIVPIHKKGEKLECSNYRGISLLSSAYKIISKLILNKLKPFIEENIGEHQAGFVQGRSTTDQIFSLKQAISKYWEYNKNVHILFIDFNKAYDSIDRSKLYKMMEMAGIPRKLIKLTKMCIEKSKSKVRVEGEYTESFEITTGVRQGDGLSPLLFNLAIEKALREAKQSVAGLLIRTKINVVAFADDVALLAECKADLIELSNIIIHQVEKVGLTVNENKTKYLVVSRNQEHEDNLMVGEMEFEKVKEFQYLGVKVTADNREDIEIKNRIVSASKGYWALEKLLKSRMLSRNTKIRIYHTMILPVLLYGSETWVLRKDVEKKLIIFENRILRKIFGPIEENGVYRIRKNRELRAIYKFPDVIAYCKSRRIRWAGHVWRRSEDSMIRAVWTGQPQGRRPLGRPKLRWQDQLMKDLERMGVAIQEAEDRSEWRRVVDEAKNHLGFEEPRR